MKTENITLLYFLAERYNNLKGQTQDYSNFPRPLSAVAYIENGEADFICENNVVHVEKGDIIFTPAGSTYFLSWTSDSKIISCHFKFLRGGPLTDGHYEIQKVEKSFHLYDDFLFLLENVKKEDKTLDITARFLMVCADFIPKLTKEERQIPDIRIKKATDYIKENFDKPITVEELARLCNISTSYFFARFKVEKGMSPIEYKNRIAVRYAEELLAMRPYLSVEEISSLAGFTSSGYFRRVFHDISGCSPREYRRAAEKMI